MKPTITIHYCPKCQWLARAAWYSQEILQTFETEIEHVALKPSEVAGRFSFYINDDLVYDRKREGHFPDAKEIKVLIRNVIAPDKSLGHSETKST